MSLQIWLPLINDIHNQGLMNLDALTPSYNNMTFNNVGKIGKCGTGGLAWHLTEDILDNAWSVATWFKTSSSFGSNNNVIFCKNSTQSTDCQIYFSIVNGNSLHMGVNGSYDSLSQSYTFEINTWYHVATTYDGTKASLYINGVFQTSTNVTTAKPNGRLNIRINGRSTNAGNTSSTGGLDGYSFNDFRLYDHALSAAEVAEIAKGLVLHYKLDDQFAEPTTNLASTGADGWDNSGTCIRTANDTSIPNPPTSGNVYSIRATSDGSMAAHIGETGSNYPSKTIIASVWVWLDGTQDSSSFYLRSVKTNSSVGNLSYNGNTNPSTWPKQKWIRIATNPITTASDATKFYLCTYVNKNTEVRAFNGWQIEEKDHITPWTAPGTTRTPTTIYDCSGYGNNGTIVGSLTAAAGSPRYQICTQFSGTNYFKRVSPSSEAVTISLWAKWNTIPSGQSVVYVDYKSKTGFGLMSTGILCSSCSLSSYTFDKSNIVANTWYHFVIVSPNGASNATRKLYINGIEQTPKTTTSNWSYTLDELQIGKRSTTSDGFNGKISDFRMYTTALTAEQVADLFHTSMSVDASGNIYARELREV